MRRRTASGRGSGWPTEDEWQQACQGADGRTYPWGKSEPNDRLANYDSKVGQTTAVGKYPEGASPYGAMDMAGNVWEWTSSLYKSGESNRVLRGGSWYNPPSSVRCTYRIPYHPEDRNDGVGFRCARAE